MDIFWLGIVCIVFVVLTAMLAVKVHLLRKSADEISAEFSWRLEHETNTLIRISSRDRYMRSLAEKVNDEIRLLVEQRRRFQQGDLEVKEAVTNISHDLRTPLTAICGYLTMLEEEFSLFKEEAPAGAERGEKIEGYIQILRERTSSLRQMTEELFDYTIAASGEERRVYARISLNEVLEESICGCYGALKGKGIVPEISIPKHPVWRILDRNVLVRIFENILGNAVKYSEGDLSIELRESGEIIFSNRAPGLDQVQVSQLFNRFYTVESMRRATGLGLAIARTLTEQMGGEITGSCREGVLSIRIWFRSADSR